MEKDIPHKWSQSRVGIAKIEFGPLPYTALKKKWKWKKDLNIRLITIKTVKENTREMFYDSGFGDFLTMTPKP